MLKQIVAAVIIGFVVVSAYIVSGRMIRDQMAEDDGRVLMVREGSCCVRQEVSFMAGAAHYSRRFTYGSLIEEVSYEGNFTDFLTFGLIGQPPARYIISSKGVFRVECCERPVPVKELPKIFQKIRRMGIQAIERQGDTSASNESSN